MDAKEAQSQIQQMMNFILCEAKDKADEINTKGLEEFSIEKFRIVNQQKEKIRQEYAKKAKQVETKCAIERSMAVNKSRLEKIKARQDAIGKVAEEVKTSVSASLKQADGKAIYTKMIVQAMLMLLEEEITVCCRAVDEQLVAGIVPAAQAEYAKVIKDQSGIVKASKITIDKANPLPATALGGVVVSCQRGTITVDNTLDARLKLVLEQDKPRIRQLLFPVR